VIPSIANCRQAKSCALCSLPEVCRSLRVSRYVSLRTCLSVRFVCVCVVLLRVSKCVTCSPAGQSARCHLGKRVWPGYLPWIHERKALHVSQRDSLNEIHFSSQTISSLTALPARTTARLWRSAACKTSSRWIGALCFSSKRFIMLFVCMRSHPKYAACKHNSLAQIKNHDRARFCEYVFFRDLEKLGAFLFIAFSRLLG
jgi:hypothetical protein